MRNFGIAVAAATAVVVTAFGFAGTGLAAGDPAGQKAERVVLTLGKGGDKKKLFHPDRINLEAGRRYTLVIQNPSAEVHEFDSPGLVSAVWSSGVKIFEDFGPTAQPVAEVVGTPAEMEVFPGNTVEWTFVTVVAGEYDMLCDIEDQSGKTHTEMGMKGLIVVE